MADAGAGRRAAGAGARAFAPGKLILSGEHAVVYGHPAIALAVDRGTTVHLRPCEGETRLEHSSVQDLRLFEALAAVLPLRGLAVRIDSDLPVGRGMGSSAALAVALVRARARLEGREADFAECHREGFAVERVFHGTPSGLDHAVSARGGGVLYRRTEEGVRIEPLALPPLRLVVLDSGRAGNTAELVAGVRGRRPGVDPALARMGALTLELARALASGSVAVGGLLDENHALLQQIGVSTPELDALVDLARGAGARGAKLSGAGGGGVVLALVDEPEPVLAAAARAGVAAFPVAVHPPALPDPDPDPDPGAHPERSPEAP